MASSGGISKTDDELVSLSDDMRIIGM